MRRRSVTSCWECYRRKQKVSPTPLLLLLATLRYLTSLSAIVQNRVIIALQGMSPRNVHMVIHQRMPTRFAISHVQQHLQDINNTKMRCISFRALSAVRYTLSAASLRRPFSPIYNYCQLTLLFRVKAKEIPSREQSTISLDTYSDQEQEIELGSTSSPLDFLDQVGYSAVNDNAFVNLQKVFRVLGQLDNL